jgi:hypothetical protein
MSVQELNSARSGISSRDQANQLQKWLTYVFCAAIGMVGGAIGVALTIGLMIMVTEMLVIVFEPNSYLLIGAAVLLGLGITWLFERILHFVMPGLALSQRHQQVIFVFSVLVVLLEGFIFMP